jgi:hypothetical protein
MLQGTNLPPGKSNTPPFLYAGAQVRIIPNVKGVISEKRLPAQNVGSFAPQLGQ